MARAHALPLAALVLSGLSSVSASMTEDEQDAALHKVVNILGLTVFGLILAYSYMTSTSKDAEA